MLIGVLANKDSWYFGEIQRAGALRGDTVVRLDFRQLIGRADASQTLISSGDIPLASFDALIVRTMPPGSLERVVYRMDALLALERRGIVVVNPPKTIECAVDKFLTTHRLQEAGLSVPRTIVCENAEAGMEAFGELGGDVVVKPLFGSEGRGIVRVSDPDLAWRTFRALERLNSVLYLQEFIDHPGWDLRILVLSDRVLGAMKRVNHRDFRTNAARRASVEPYQPTDEERLWALTAARGVGAWFAGVDLLYNRAGLGYVIEVNAVPGWRAFARANRIDVPLEMLSDLESLVQKRKAERESDGI